MELTNPTKNTVYYCSPRRACHLAIFDFLVENIRASVLNWIGALLRLLHIHIGLSGDVHGYLYFGMGRKRRTRV